MTLHVPGRRAGILLAAVSLAGAVLGTGLLLNLRPPDPGGLVLLVVLAAIVERQGAQLFTSSRASVSAVALMSAGMLYGAPAAVPVALAIGLAAWVLRGRPVSRLCYNSSTMVIAGTAAALTFRATTAVLPAHDAALVAAALVTGVAMWTANSVLIGAMVALTSGRGLRDVMHENFLWVVGHFAVMALVALALVLAYQAVGLLGFAAFVAPVGVLAMALRQGAAKARNAVIDARSAEAAIKEYERLLAEIESTSEDVAEFIAYRRRQLPAAA